VETQVHDHRVALQARPVFHYDGPDPFFPLKELRMLVELDCRSEVDAGRGQLFGGPPGEDPPEFRSRANRLFLGGASCHDHALAPGMDHALKGPHDHHWSGVNPDHFFAPPGVKGNDFA
jgi:hypothetical protein